MPPLSSLFTSALCRAIWVFHKWILLSSKNVLRRCAAVCCQFFHLVKSRSFDVTFQTQENYSTALGSLHIYTTLGCAAQTERPHHLTSPALTFQAETDSWDSCHLALIWATQSGTPSSVVWLSLATATIWPTLRKSYGIGNLFRSTVAPLLLKRACNNAAAYSITKGFRALANLSSTKQRS